MKRIILFLTIAASALLPTAAQEALSSAVERLQGEYPQYAVYHKAIQPHESGKLQSTIVTFSCGNVNRLRSADIDSLMAAFEREVPNAKESIRYANKIGRDTISYILNFGAMGIADNGPSLLMNNPVLGDENNRAVALLQRGAHSLWVAVKNTVLLADTTQGGIDYAPIQALIAAEHSPQMGATCRPVFYQCDGYDKTTDITHFHTNYHSECPTTGLIYTLPPREGNRALFEKYRQALRAVFDKIGRHAATFYGQDNVIVLNDEDKKATVVCLQPDGALSVLQVEEPEGFLYIPYMVNGRIRATYRNGQFGD